MELARASAAAAAIVAAANASTAAAAAAAAATSVITADSAGDDGDTSGNYDSAEERGDLFSDFRDSLQGGIPSGGGGVGAMGTQRLRRRQPDYSTPPPSPPPQLAPTRDTRGRALQSPRTVPVPPPPPPPSPPPPPPPPETKSAQLMRDVAVYATDYVRIHSRLIDMCTGTLALARMGALPSAARTIPPPLGLEHDEAQTLAAEPEPEPELEQALRVTSAVLVMLTAAAGGDSSGGLPLDHERQLSAAQQISASGNGRAGGAPLEAAAAAAAAAAAVLRLGLVLSKTYGPGGGNSDGSFSLDSGSQLSTTQPISGGGGGGGGGGGAVRVVHALRAYVAAALARHPTSLADVRERLAATLLARPFQLLPPLTADASVYPRSRS